MRRTILALLLTAFQSFGADWYKGQLHCHTTNSFDGQVPPARVAAMYQAAGYSFIAISDHNFITQAQPYNTPIFLTIPSDELSLGSGEAVRLGYVAGPIHVNAINISGAQQPPGNPTTLQGVIDLVSSDPGVIVQIDHPAPSRISSSTILGSHGALLMEVIQGSSTAANAAIWDAVLSGGLLLYATGSDDCHNSGNFNRGWIVVRSDSLTPSAILAAIRDGDFYASSGPAISSISMTNRTLTVASNGSQTTFIGEDGVVLRRVNSGSASYKLPAGGLYVRAVVSTASGGVAYTQPYFPERSASGPVRKTPPP